MSGKFDIVKRDDLIMSLSEELRRPSQLLPTDAITIAAYNLYNLFDEEGDRPKPPEEMKAIAEMILHIAPDVIAFAEVQSEQTLRTLFATYISPKLKGTRKYDGFVCLPGNDPRHIHVALVTRLAIKGALTFNDREFESSPGKTSIKFSRDLLGVAIQMTPDASHTYLHFAAHLKSKIGGERAEEKRRLEASEIVGILTESTFGSPFMGQNFVLTGDMNDDPDGKAVAVLNNAGLADKLADVDPNFTYPTLINASARGKRKYPATRLDYLFASPSIVDRVSGVAIHRPRPRIARPITTLFPPGCGCVSRAWRSPRVRPPSSD